MNQYDDIRDLTSEEPRWHDENGVPRYARFHPSMVPDVYADEAVLLAIRCQACGRGYAVSLSSDGPHEAVTKVLEGGKDVEIVRDRLARQIEEGVIHYGDSPCWAEDCASGATMNCEDIRVLEYWSRVNVDREWRRNPTYEIALPGFED